MSDEDLWLALRRFTPARLALGRSGAALPTKALLEFGVAHAQARDAVHSAVDWPRLEAGVRELSTVPVIKLDSSADDRATYLRRPDLGRRLSLPSLNALSALSKLAPGRLALVLADGLSASALEHHGLGILKGFLASRSGSRLGAIVLARNARVALGDQIGATLGAQFVVVAIGERPGLSSPDSLGLYLTYEPRLGRTDAERNCLSNIHAAGMSYQIATRKLDGLIEGALMIEATGTRLKDESGADGLLLGQQQQSQAGATALAIPHP